jgi:hypothetical protein
MIQVTVKATGARAKLAKLAAGLTPAATDAVVDRAAFETLAALIEATPKRWTGQTRRGWHVTTPALGVRIVSNPNKVMGFLEYGTQAHGPVTAKALFVPLEASAMGGYRPGMKFGKQFVLAKRVRGIQAMHIAEQERPRVRARLLAGMERHVRTLIAA